MNLPVVPGVSIRLIQQVVSRHYRLPIEAMRTSDRRREFAWPRQMAMALCREFTTKSLPTIGRHFGGRDHTTVLHACRALPKRASWHHEIAQDFAMLSAVLGQIAPKPAEVSLPDLYAELGLEPGASHDQLKAAHRTKVREHHPDRGGDFEAFHRAQRAYSQLKSIAT